ncbi:3-methyladenine DNA glycosylase [Ornithinimicrobium cryptoxanthini]|uniref:3-methyladenine DNA glycosylase n=1 Tax=Ornithinimicrobium cryptoxanthini TaxID=2934161 RepID=A0ABY4YFL1_9MICO|nr:3-methyladenine DNA glycosylase [Ornithinimicrobium cryptoxanthini]USQ75566.1 3-methyladenine DNA glycosylase [Ornithinimicrobium cryptoxanthini]
MTTQVLPASDWRSRAEEHEAAVDALTAARLERRTDGRKHPVEDFLFEYYHHRPGQLRRWHPGAEVALEGAAERADWPFYAYAEGRARVDVASFVAKRESVLLFVRALLTSTLSRPGRFGCFGLHEWAMVYRADDEAIRHGGWPLRLGPDGTNEVVEQATITCSHFDAYRFFTPDAAHLNTLAPTREQQVAMEQPGCLHAGMDVYKWCFKLSPLVPSDLTLDAFRLAREIRELDMRAAPYDLTELGYEPVRIETPEGRAEYAAAQRRFSERSNDLRRRLLDILAGS